MVHRHGHRLQVRLDLDVTPLPRKNPCHFFRQWYFLTNERFDQARTKVYNMKLWITTGDVLYSKLNNPMMTIVEDQFAGRGGTRPPILTTT